MEPITRIGVFGGGGILGAHAPGLRALAGRGIVVAVAEPDPAKAPRIRDLLGAEAAIYPDYQTLLARAAVDAVDILLPHHLHLPATEAAARAGCHVLVEKVMACDVAECDRMIAACEDAGVTLTVCHDRRYHPEWKALRDLVASGALGEIHSWKLDHNQDVDPAARGLGWVASRQALGGGAIMSCLTHQIDALRWMGGEFSQVACMTRVVPGRMEGETMGVIVGRMASGALAHLAINWMTRSNAADGLWYELIHVTGSRGEAFCQSGRGTFARLGDAGAFTRIETGAGQGHVRCIAEWLKRVRGEPTDISTDGRDARRTVEVAQAAYAAEAAGRSLTLPLSA